MVGFLERLHSPERPVLVFDGATGTSLQQMELTAVDFGGSALEGCNEILVRTRPDVVRAVHKQFLDAGCDVIETNTFGSTSLVLAEYDLENEAFELNRQAALLAREMADQYTTDQHPRYVAGSMGHMEAGKATHVQSRYDQEVLSMNLRKIGSAESGKMA